MSLTLKQQIRIQSLRVSELQNSKLSVRYFSWERRSQLLATVFGWNINSAYYLLKQTNQSVVYDALNYPNSLKDN